MTATKRPDVELDRLRKLLDLLPPFSRADLESLLAYLAHLEAENERLREDMAELRAAVCDFYLETGGAATSWREQPHIKALHRLAIDMEGEA